MIKRELIPFVKYHINGEIYVIGNHNSKGEREGLWEFFYDNGNKSAIHNYKNGKQTGIQQFFNQNGDIIIDNNIMEKLIKDGKVGVIISGGWGSGFYTWNAPLEAVFNPQLIELIEREDFDEATEFIKKTYPDVYSKQSFLSNTTDLVVEWVEKGREFYITEYDGMESIVFKDEIKWITA